MREPRLAITLLPIASSSFYALAVIVPVVPLLVALQESEPASPFGRGPLIVLVKELSPRQFLSVVSTVVDDFEFVGGSRVKEERRCYMLRKCDMREWLVVVAIVSAKKPSSFQRW